MNIASFIGEKGGVGKTTNAHSVAHGLSCSGAQSKCGGRVIKGNFGRR